MKTRKLLIACMLSMILAMTTSSAFAASVSVPGVTINTGTSTLLGGLPVLCTANHVSPGTVGVTATVTATYDSDVPSHRSVRTAPHVGLAQEPGTAIAVQLFSRV